MVTFIVVASAVWVAGAILAGLAVGRVITRADHDVEPSGAVPEGNATAAL